MVTPSILCRNLDNMGKPDPKQGKIPLESKRQTRTMEYGTLQGAASSQDNVLEDPEEDMRSILLDVRTSLKTIDSKIDALSSRLEAVKKKVNVHETRLDGLENRLSDVQDSHSETRT